MRVLCIGNSFSQDATRFLHQLSDGANLDLTCVNLYIGGCSLKRHWDEYTSGNESYSYEYNGEPLHSTALLPALQDETGISLLFSRYLRKAVCMKLSNLGWISWQN